MYMDPNGLAARVGLTGKTMSMDGLAPCNWALTEVNMRPLNLFPKDMEVSNAVFDLICQVIVKSQ